MQSYISTSQSVSQLILNLVVLYKKGQKEECLSSLNKAISMKDDYVKAYVKRGEVNQELDNHEEAVRDFSSA